MAKPAMTREQIKAAGYAIVKFRPIGSKEPPWRIMRGGTTRENPFVLWSYETRQEAIAALHEELNDPDGTLRPEGVN